MTYIPRTKSWSNYMPQLKKCHVQMPIPVQNPKFQKTSGSFQEWWNFEILYWKSSSLTKNEWKRYPICWKQLKLANSSPLYRVPEKILEVSKNDGILKFCVENQVSWHKLSGIHTLHVEISQKWPIPGLFWNPGILDSRIQKS